jgi:4-hydroxy-tetrahydrodipicolinate synthase
VVWGELSYILYGKLRPLVNQYRQLAAEGKWEEAYQVSCKLDPVRDYYADIFLWTVAQTATYASALAGIKVWFEEIGLHAGRIMPPVREASDAFKEDIRENLRRLGVV